MGALRGREHGVDGREHAGAVSLQGVERTGGGQALQHALVDGMRVDPSGKIGKTGKGTLAARRDDRLDRLAADTFEGGERVVYGVPSTSNATPERLIDGGSTLTPRRTASAEIPRACRYCPCRGSSEAARNSTGWFVFI
jgi:hypothetical protein